MTRTNDDDEDKDELFYEIVNLRDNGYTFE